MMDACERCLGRRGGALCDYCTADRLAERTDSADRYENETVRTENDELPESENPSDSNENGGAEGARTPDL